MRFDNVRLLTTRFAAMFAFYRDVLQLQVTWGEPDGKYASFGVGSGSTGIALFARELMAVAVGTAALPAEPTAQDRAALIFEVESVDAFADRVRQMGVLLVTEPTDMPDWGIRTAHLRDPDGNLLEAFSSLPKAEWSELLLAEAAQQPVA